METLVSVWRASRPNFLILTPACVLIGISTAVLGGAQAAPMMIALIMAGGLLAHAAVNLLNEYGDFRSGLDLVTVRTPFSGGSGALPAHPAAAPAVLMASLVALSGCVAIGVALSLHSGPGLMLPGLVGLTLVLTYTTRITRHPIACLIAPGLGFGPVMVMGTHYVLTGSFSTLALWASMTPMLLVSALLLVNQFPDLEADRSHGRRHFPILLGRASSSRFFAALLIGAYLIPVLGVIAGPMPKWSLLVLLPAPAAALVAFRVQQLADRPEHLNPWLGLNVATLFATLLLLGAGLLIAA